MNLRYEQALQNRTLAQTSGGEHRHIYTCFHFTIHIKSWLHQNYVKENLMLNLCCFSSLDRDMHTKNILSMISPSFHYRQKNLIVDSTAFKPVGSSDRISDIRFGILVVDNLQQSSLKTANSLKIRNSVSDRSVSHQRNLGQTNRLRIRIDDPR